VREQGEGMVHGGGRQKNPVRRVPMEEPVGLEQVTHGNDFWCRKRKKAGDRNLRRGRPRF